MFCPYIINFVLETYNHNYNIKFSELFLKSLLEISDFYTRLILQIFFLAKVSQIFQDSNKLKNSFESVVKNNGKTKFEHWYYDLSFKSSLAITFMTFGLFFSLVFPQISLIQMVFFIYQFFIDKYNLMYLYPLDFESKTISRKILVKNSFFAIVLFQVFMISLGVVGNNLVSPKPAFYLYAFVCLQLIVILIVFEIFRKPWEGMEIELEKILELQQNKILDDSMSSMTMTDNLKLQVNMSKQNNENSDDNYFPSPSGFINDLKSLQANRLEQLS